MAEKINIKMAELHSTLFLAGTNLGVKLDPAKKGGLNLEYDRAEKELLVTYNNQTAIVPTTNVVSMVSGAIEKKEENQHQTHHVGKMTAQVESPQGHVFAGAGHGKTGRG